MDATSVGDKIWIKSFVITPWVLFVNTRVAHKPVAECPLCTAFVDKRHSLQLDRLTTDYQQTVNMLPLLDHNLSFSENKAVRERS